MHTQSQEIPATTNQCVFCMIPAGRHPAAGGRPAGGGDGGIDRAMSAPTNMREVEWEHIPLVEPIRDSEIEQWARERGAPRIYPLRFFTRCPWLARSVARLSTLDLACLDHNFADLTVLVISRDNSCRYCYAGARFLLRISGMSEASIEMLEGEFLTAELEPRRRLGLEFARRISRSNPPPSATDIQALRNVGISHQEILELAYVTAQYSIINRLTTLLALPVESVERLDRGWVAGLLRPSLGRRLKRRREPSVDCDSIRRRAAWAVRRRSHRLRWPTGRTHASPDPRRRLVVTDSLEPSQGARLRPWWRAPSAQRGSKMRHSSYWPRRPSTGTLPTRCSPTWPLTHSTPLSLPSYRSPARRSGTDRRRFNAGHASCATS